MQNSTSSNNSLHPAPTDITPSMSGMSEACYGNDVWTCNDTLRYLGDRSIKATDTMRSAKFAHVEAVKNSMSMHRDEDGNGDRSSGTAQGNHTGQALDEAIERSMTASARVMTHHAEHPDGSIRSLERVPCNFLPPAERELSRREHSTGGTVQPDSET